eukprot:173868_1
MLTPIHMTNIDDHHDEKSNLYEDYEQYVTISMENHKTYKRGQFLSPNDSEYTHCSAGSGNIECCSIMSRIIYLLNLAKEHERQIQQLSEEFERLNEYNLTILMDDWYHVKRNHIDELKRWGCNQKHIYCGNDSKCSHILRYQRDREMDRHPKDIDIKKEILMDVLDSIHSYLFHPLTENTLYDRIEKKDVDDIWLNEPKSIEECNVEQIVSIINEHLFDMLKPNIAIKLSEYKMKIIEYIKLNKLNGNMLMSMNRKKFVSEMKEHLKLTDNKLKAPIAGLYSTITNYNISTHGMNKHKDEEKHEEKHEQKESEDVFQNQPKLIDQCNADQIQWLLKHKIFDELTQNAADKLVKYKKAIIEYFQEYKIDGRGLKCIDRKEFATKIKSHLHLKDNKLKYPLVILHSKMLQYDLSKVAQFKQNVKSNCSNKQEQHLTSPKIHQNGKFVTKIDSKSHGKYSFGVQYRYTDNLREHPLFIKPKHNSVKKELIEYFIELNKKKDLSTLLQAQSEIITCIDPSIQFVGTKLIKAERLTDDDIQSLLKHKEPKSKIVNMCYDLIIQLCNVLGDKSIGIFNLDIMRRIPYHEFTGNNLEKHEDREFVMQSINNFTKNKPNFEFFLLSVRISLVKMFKLNQQKYLETKQNERLLPFIEKSTIKMKMKSVREMKAVWYQNINQDHKVYPNSPIQEQHVFCLIMYSQCSQFCSAFRETYRKQREHETLGKQKERHSAYGHIGRAIYEAFVFFASVKDCITILYHGMSMPLLFSNMYCVFNAPTSTTTATSVALAFGNTGIMIQMQSADSTQYIRALDMSPFTCFDHEEEYLIFETRCHITDIYIPSESRYIGKDLMNVISLYDQLIHGMRIHDKSLLKKKTQRCLFRMIQHAMNGTLSTWTRSLYVNSLVIHLTKTNKQIWLNVEQISNLSNDKLREMFILENQNKFGSFISFLKNKHNAMVSPIFVSKWIVNQHTFELISKASQNQQQNVKIMVYGPLTHCKLSDGRFIVFQPRLTKIEQAYHTEMHFIDSYNGLDQGLDIKVHFDVDCDGAAQYFASLHPRVMNVKWNNAFHVELPALDVDYDAKVQKDKQLCDMCCGGSTQLEKQTELMVITISTMIHNFDEFEQNVQCISNTTQQTDMSSSYQSYTFPVILSIFYGISNSIISLFDSASDIYFIVLLFMQPRTPVIMFLIMLSIGNLFSSAIAIGCYLTKDIEVRTLNDTLLQLLLTLLFALMSPFLPALKWLLKRLDIISNNVLIIDTKTDGILLWFQMELIKNKLFIIETLFESCFQIIIQFVAVFIIHRDNYQYIYLWSSIAISTTVIISKFILLSYNQHRSVIAFNLLTYVMDIYFSLLFSIFVGAFIFQRIFNFVGFYLVLELLLLVPCSAHFIADRLHLPWFLYIPFFTVLWYPITISVFSSFTMYSFWIKTLTNPDKIGRKRE